MPSLTEAEDVLAQVHSTYAHRNPLSHQAHLSSCEQLPGGNTRTVLHVDPFPITFASGNGCTLTSLDGHTYIDFLGEYTAGIYGHNNTILRTAINDALDKGWSLGGNNSYEKELAKLVCERFQPTMEQVRFTNSGTEANMMAVAAAIAWTGRKKVLVFGGGYHGATLSFRASPAGATHKDVNLPHEWVIAPYNDISQTRDILSHLPADSLAVILVEAMLGSGGAIPGTRPFLEFLRSYASSHGALLIFDEVMTSRLSYRGLGHKLGIQPDMMTLGKWVGGGMSFGAFGGRADVMAMFDPRKSGSLAHAGTFNNNVISMAAGCAGCKILDEKHTNRLNALGEHMKKSVQDVIDGTLDAHSTTKNSAAPELSNGNGVSPRSAGPSNGLAGAGYYSPPSSDSTNPVSTSPHFPMYITGLGSILAVHLPTAHLQSVFYHHMLSEEIYMAERGFISLNIELEIEDVLNFVRATGRFVEKYADMILRS